MEQKLLSGLEVFVMLDTIISADIAEFQDVLCTITLNVVTSLNALLIIIYIFLFVVSYQKELRVNNHVHNVKLNKFVLIKMGPYLAHS